MFSRTLCFVLLVLPFAMVDAAEIDYSPGMSNTLYPFVDMPMPAVGKPYREPVFNTTITRITDVRNGGFPARVTGLTNEYSRYDPLNADATLLLVRGTDASWHLYGLKPYRYKGTILGKRGDFSPRWHATDPDILFFVMGTKFYKYHVQRGVKSLVYDFKARYPAATFIKNGKGEGSLDSRYWAFMIVNYDNDKPAGKKRTLLDIVTFDAIEKRVIGSLQAVTKKSRLKVPRTVTVSMSGKYVLVEYIPEVQVYNLNWSNGRQLPGSFGHGDLALDKQRRDVFVAQENDTDHIAMVDLDTLDKTNVMDIPFHSPFGGGVGYPGFHISGNSSDTPGWVLISTYGNAERPSYWSDGVIFLLELSKNGRHWRIAHTYSRTAKGKNKDYWAEAFATIDRKGKHVFWSSNWGVARKKYVDLYQVTLPDSWFSDLTKK